MISLFKPNITYLLIFAAFFISCTSDSVSQTNESENANTLQIGSGVFDYNFISQSFTKSLRIFYHIPSNFNADTEMVFVFHGAGRNAKDYRDAMITKANQYGFIIIAPEFAFENFPGGDFYNLGNVFTDGDNPTNNTLNNEEDWTFSVIEPLFENLKIRLQNTTESYNIFGHSAGAQFAHRLIMFKPNGNYKAIVASASGWYTTTDFDISFPYGFKNSPLADAELQVLFQKNVKILIGSEDNNPNASGLRRNEFADLQGINRKERATFFYNKAENISENLNLTFNWEFGINNGANHDFRIAINRGADLLFN